MTSRRLLFTTVLSISAAIVYFSKSKWHATMTSHYEPFTPELFQQQTGLSARDNEAIYIRWVNSQMNYATFQLMKEMTASLKEIILLLQENNKAVVNQYPFTK